MDVAERSRTRVRARLAKLDEEFDSPAVNQTTVAVGETAYRRAVELSRDGQVDIKAVVQNESGEVLLKEAEGGWAIPRGHTKPGERLKPAAKRVVREAAGVDCTITEAVRATISGVRNSDDADAETVYRLGVVFAAESDETTTSPQKSVRWDTRPDSAVEIFSR